jgi:hypothetical protein
LRLVVYEFVTKIRPQLESLVRDLQKSSSYHNHPVIRRNWDNLIKLAKSNEEKNADRLESGPA